MILPSEGIAAVLDEIAERIRAATNYDDRAAAIAAFKTACENNASGPLNPALEAINRDIILANPL